MKNQSNNLDIIGWREYICFPEFQVDSIKAKIDTGAKTSALHAFNVHLVEIEGKNMVNFEIHPLQKNNDVIVQVSAPFTEYREVKNSGGKVEKRPVITTPIMMGKYQWQIELTLTNRDTMGFRMLLGRDAIKNHFLVHCGESFLLS